MLVAIYADGVSEDEKREQQQHLSGALVEGEIAEFHPRSGPYYGAGKEIFAVGAVAM
ncbi:MAG: hypothetical protein LBS77_02765 [Desulfovibrio sp.]|jgi:hypothetical protein|nr:hypothetical protein [Desulfovibrio sp.]